VDFSEIRWEEARAPFLVSKGRIGKRGGQLGRLTKHWVWAGLGALVAAVGLCGLGIAAYLGLGQASATALIKSARVIRTTADAERNSRSFQQKGA